MKPEQLISQIQSGKVPPLILIGGNSEFLVERAFRDVRDAIEAARAGLEIESFPPDADLGAALDAWRTHSLFGSPRLLIIPELQAFVTRKDIDTHLGKAVDDWKAAKTDRKRTTAIAKLMHVLGLIGADPSERDDTLIEALGVPAKQQSVVREMLEHARSSNRKSTRGEGDAALLAEAIAGGGAPGAVLLMRSGEVPEDSATVRRIGEKGAVVVCDLTREQFLRALEQAIGEVAEENEVQFPPGAISALRARMGIDRVLSDKFSKEIPDLRAVVNEAERIALLAGRGGTVTPAMIGGEIEQVGGGARFEFTSLYTEGKYVDAVEKLRELIAQARREESKTAVEIHYGRFIFPLADEIRQSIGILSFCRLRRIDPRRSMSYNQFRDALAEPLGEFLKERGLVRQKPHPFPLFKKFESAAGAGEGRLLAALAALAEMDFQRKSGGAPLDVALESFVLSGGRV